MARKVTKTDSVTSTKSFGLQRINQYTLLKKVGLGAFGEVYMAIEPAKNPMDIDKTYAVKIIKKSKIPGFSTGKSMLTNEINALKGLYHPHIV
jgi:serine/threonine protein kinase